MKSTQKHEICNFKAAHFFPNFRPWTVDLSCKYWQLRRENTEILNYFHILPPASILSSSSRSLMLKSCTGQTLRCAKMPHYCLTFTTQQGALLSFLNINVLSVNVHIKVFKALSKVFKALYKCSSVLSV